MIRVLNLIAGLALISVASISSAGSYIWQDANHHSASKGGLVDARRYQADHYQLRARLAQVPHETAGDQSYHIELPMPDGRMERFSIVESPIMAPGLAAKYPDVKTFKVFGIDDPLASGRVDITSRGFHAMLHTSSGRVFIDPEDSPQRTDLYASRYRAGQTGQRFSCGIHKMPDTSPLLSLSSAVPAQRVPGKLMSYRLAISATAEYRNRAGGDVSDAMDAIIIAINRVNEIYERDLGIRLKLVSNNDDLIEIGGNVSFTNNSAFDLLEENQAWVDETIGSGKYDIGHVFSTGGGGLAQLGVACDGELKAQGVSGALNPFQDPFYVDFVAHEIGHQLDADHTFNGTTNSCGGLNRNASTAVEPGSGSTIMSYAGICGAEDLQFNSNDSFHATSINQINSFTSAEGSCFSRIKTSPANNKDPVIKSVSNRTIPQGTPFALTAKATDAESGSNISYQWDQLDFGQETDSATFGDALGNNALFRSYAPQAIARRDFPALGTQVSGFYDAAEVLPCQDRELNFRLTVRDNNSGLDNEDVVLKVAGDAGPFRVTSQTKTTSIPATDASFAVKWDVANTNLAPVNCSSVAVDLLAFDDGDYTNYSVHKLVSSTPNDGSVTVTRPTTWLENPVRGRIRVRCTNNVFYALSEGDLQIEGDDPRVDYDTDDQATFFNNNGTTSNRSPGCTILPEITVVVEDDDEDSGGSGGFGWWCLLLSTLVVALRQHRSREI